MPIPVAPPHTGLTRIRLYDVLRFEGKTWYCDEVNDCRARLVVLGGKEFISISPEAALETLGRWLPDEKRVRLAGPATPHSVDSHSPDLPAPVPATQPLTQFEFL